MIGRLTTPKNAVAAALALAAVGFIASELIERVGGLVPCELCIIQRWSVFAAALFLGLSLWSPGRWLSVSGWTGASLATLTGLAAALRHVWLQTHPGEPLGCLPDIFGAKSAAAASAPSSELAMLANPFQSLNPAPSACSVPQAVTLGYTLADWSLVYAAILVSFVVIALAVGARANRRPASQL
jgi:protein dithiol:quinone oxidoreductase